MLRGGSCLVLSTLVAVLLHSSHAQSPTTGELSATQSTSSAPTTSSSSASRTDEPAPIKFWRQNWLWFLIGFLVVVIPIILWAVLGPGRKWYRNRRWKRHSAQPPQWNRVGNERFQNFYNPSMRDMRQIREISRSRGSGSSSRSDVALSSNAAAPGEQDLEAYPTNSSPTNTMSAYVRRERLMRNESTEAVIGLVQPQSLMPPTVNGDRNSTESLGPPDPHVHRAHPRYNSFQRYSRQHRRRTESISALNPMLLQREELRASMQLPSDMIPKRKSLPDPPSERTSIQANTAVQRVPLPKYPPTRPFHIRQSSSQSVNSLHGQPSMHNRSTSWHQPTHRHASPAELYPSRHVSMDGYHPISEPVQFNPSEPRRSVSRGRLQKPQHLNPRQSQQVTQQAPRREVPQMSFYRPPQSSRETLPSGTWPLATSDTTISTTSASKPTYPKPVYPARSALSSRSQPKEDIVHGTETGYSYSITGGANPPASAKSVKFAALPQNDNEVPGRFPIRRV